MGMVKEVVTILAPGAHQGAPRVYSRSNISRTIFPRNNHVNGKKNPTREKVDLPVPPKVVPS